MEKGARKGCGDRVGGRRGKRFRKRRKVEEWRWPVQSTHGVVVVLSYQTYADLKPSQLRYCRKK
ncbi:hypothetical protein Ancab_032230 [Ancistrocladus abbreviatus]